MRISNNSYNFRMGATEVKERPKNKFRIAIELAVNDDIVNKR